VIIVKYSVVRKEGRILNLENQVIEFGKDRVQDIELG
jgi:hypothetical protein